MNDAEIQAQDQAALEKKHIIMVKLWHQDTWDLDAPVELWLDKDANLGDFANEISEKLKISTNSICCTKINSPWNFHRVELPYIEWI